jgi:hypothetical protein
MIPNFYLDFCDNSYLLDDMSKEENTSLHYNKIFNININFLSILLYIKFFFLM